MSQSSRARRRLLMTIHHAPHTGHHCILSCPRLRRYRIPSLSSPHGNPGARSWERLHTSPTVLCRGIEPIAIAPIAQHQVVCSGDSSPRLLNWHGPAERSFCGNLHLSTPDRVWTSPRHTQTRFDALWRTPWETTGRAICTKKG